MPEAILLKGKYRRDQAPYLSEKKDVSGAGQKRRATKGGNAGPHGGSRTKATEKAKAAQRLQPALRQSTFNNLAAALAALPKELQLR